MLTRGWLQFVAVLALMALDRFVSVVFAWPSDIAMEPIASPYDEDAAESELTEAIYEQPAVEQAPPPVSMPIGNRFVHAEPQNFPRYTPIDDGWMLDSQRVLLDAAT